MRRTSWMIASIAAGALLLAAIGLGTKGGHVHAQMLTNSPTVSTDTLDPEDSTEPTDSTEPVEKPEPAEPAEPAQKPGNEANDHETGESKEKDTETNTEHKSTTSTGHDD